MNFARDLTRDLIAKRLWPVVLVLVGALVAIPLAFGGGGTPSTPGGDLPPVSAPTAAQSATPIELVAPASVASRGGRVVDPFRRPRQAPVTTSSTTSSASGGSTADTGSAPGGGAGASPPGASPPAESGPVAPKPSLSVYRTTVLWSSTATPKARRISRLTALGGVTSPALLYLGVAADRKHALFLLGPDATSTGEAGCLNIDCRVISLKNGDTQIVDLQPAGAATIQFELKVMSVRRHELASASAAADERRLEHPDGRDVLRLLLKDRATADAMGQLAYDAHDGVMVKAKDGRPLAAP